MNIIEQIKAEIERRIRNPKLGKMTRIELQHFLSFLDTLEEKSEIPTNLDFDKAWEEYGKSKGGGAITVNVKHLARHFYELGRSEKPNNQWSEEDEEMLEYVIGDVNDAKQLYTTQEAKDMADKEIAWLKSLRPQPKPEQPVCEDFDLEADRFLRGLKLRADTPPIPDEYIDEETFDKIARHFAQWMREKMMKGAVEGEVMTNGFYPYEPRIVAPYPNCPYDFGDKVKLIIVKEEEK